MQIKTKSYYDYICLVAAYNRKQKTKIALQTISSVLDNIKSSYLIILIDASSSDGTNELGTYFKNVKLLTVPESCFWAKSMNFGYSYVSNQNLKYEKLIVFNDDVSFNFSDLNDFLQFSRNKDITVGPVCDEGGKLSYGGVKRASKLNPLAFSHTNIPTTATCDTLNMNVAVIDAKVLQECGFLSDYFDHGGADYEFGLRARDAGFKIIQYGQFVGVCNRNFDKDQILHSKGYIFKTIIGKKYFPFPIRYKYYRKYGGAFWFIFLFTPYLRAILHDLKVFLR